MLAPHNPLRALKGLSLLCVGACATSAHYDPDALRSQVWMETNCGQVTVISARDVREYHSRFELLVCGQRQVWQSYGDNYYPIGQGLSDEP